MMGLVVPNADPAWEPAWEANWFDPYCERMKIRKRKISVFFYLLLQVYIFRCQVMIDKLIGIDGPG